ncbi:HD-GYP domain-containing protein [Bacillus tuaregi]|uniref:HD-GYP domain-containing protein n=1 Tax=Bacillus tuaregi TaxID=1816695 RepID=UPI0008F81B49|nr:HD-GYP domain-containing protein [Bacillus tuaregi]
MLVKVDHLIEGCIVSEDILGRIGYPIVKKNTVLTNDLIDIMKLFLIHTVQVEKTLISGEPFVPVEVILEEIVKKATDFTQSENGGKDFISLFLYTAEEYHKQFQLWQSGIPIEITTVRQLLLPLLNEGLEKSVEIFSLHHYSTVERYPYQHAVAVGLLSGFIAEKLKYSKGEIVQTALAGTLADCGMAKINPRILQKSAALTIQEYSEVKNHPKYSYQMVRDLPLLKEGAKIAVLQHHERLDGSGYPISLKSSMIHPIAKIIAVADTYHAMTSERLYRKKQSPFKVLEMLEQDYFGQFDLASLRALSSGIVNFSTGSSIKLSNGKVGEVLFINDKSPTRPLIKFINTEEILNLEESRNLYIEEVMNI